MTHDPGAYNRYRPPDQWLVVFGLSSVSTEDCLLDTKGRRVEGKVIDVEFSVKFFRGHPGNTSNSFVG